MPTATLSYVQRDVRHYFSQENLAKVFGHMPPGLTITIGHEIPPREIPRQGFDMVTNLILDADDQDVLDVAVYAVISSTHMPSPYTKVLSHD